jgi:hypothetical protein
MADFLERYRQAFAFLGRPLRREDGIPQKDLLAAEKHLGLRLPLALREYYQLAGNATDFNCAHDRLLSPADFVVENHKLVFMEENQAVVLYSIPANPDPDDDPPVFMGTNDNPIRWHRANEKCSVFFLVMLHWQAAFGGAMPHCRTAKVRPALRKVLDSTWSFIGEVNRMRAYQENGQSLCFVKWMPEWRVFVGSGSEASLVTIADEMGLEWDDPGTEP